MVCSSQQSNLTVKLGLTLAMRPLSLEVVLLVVLLASLSFTNMSVLLCACARCEHMCTCACAVCVRALSCLRELCLIQILPYKDWRDPIPQVHLSLT